MKFFVRAFHCRITAWGSCTLLALCQIAVAMCAQTPAIRRQRNFFALASVAMGLQKVVRSDRNNWIFQRFYGVSPLGSRRL